MPGGPYCPYMRGGTRSTHMRTMCMQTCTLMYAFDNVTCIRDAHVRCSGGGPVEDVVGEHVGDGVSHRGPRGVQERQLRWRGCTRGRTADQRLRWLQVRAATSAHLVDIIHGDEAVPEQLLWSDGQKGVRKIGTEPVSEHLVHLSKWDERAALSTDNGKEIDAPEVVRAVDVFCIRDPGAVPSGTAVRAPHDFAEGEGGLDVKS